MCRARSLITRFHQIEITNPSSYSFIVRKEAVNMKLLTLSIKFSSKRLIIVESSVSLLYPRISTPLPKALTTVAAPVEHLTMAAVLME